MLNYLINNDLVFYSMFVGMGGFISYKFVSTYFNSFYVDKSIQTDAWEDYSDRPSQIGSKSVTSLETITPKFSPTDYVNTGVQTISGDTSTVTTVLAIPPVNIEIIPNADINLATQSLVDIGVQTNNNPESIVSITEIDLIDLLESPIKPLDSIYADEWAVDCEWDAEDLIKIASFFTH